MKEKAFELRQSRSKLLDENRGIIEKAEGEKRALTPDEEARSNAIFTQADDLAKRISTIERQLATEAVGPDNPGRRSDPLPHQDAGNVKGRRYSLMKAIRQASSRGQEPLDGLELETSQEIAIRSKKAPQGFFMPLGASKLGRRRGPDGRREVRALDIANTGGPSVQTTLAADWITLLRNRMVVIEAGATEITGLHGKFAIPRQNAAATAYWVAESGAPTGSNQTLDQVLFTPKTVGAFTDISRRFFELSNIDGDEFVMEDLSAIIARGIDLAALAGTGSSNQPTGLLSNSAITQVVPFGTNGAAPTFPLCVQMETVVSRSNADLGDLAYVTNADGRGTLKTTVKFSGQTYPIFLWEDGELNGHRALATQQLPRNYTKGTGSNLSPLIFGNWADLFLAYWSGVDILVDPYTGSSSGTVRIVALQDVDTQVRHPESFAYATDMITNQG